MELTGKFLPQLIPIAHAAGKAIMQIYASAFDVRSKDDASPVTLADEQAEAIIIAGLRALTPDIPIVAEESVHSGVTPRVGDRFWLVDPLDGTREFIKRNGEFTVNIALIESGTPTIGVVFAPAHNELYAVEPGTAPFIEDHNGRRPIACRTPPPEGLTVLTSRSADRCTAIESLLRNYTVAKRVQVGSSLKLCQIAAGAADFYPRIGRTMEWDIAAGQAILVAAGGRVTTLDGAPLTYGKPHFENPDLLACGG